MRSWALRSDADGLFQAAAGGRGALLGRATAGGTPSSATAVGCQAVASAPAAVAGTQTGLSGVVNLGRNGIRSARRPPARGKVVLVPPSTQSVELSGLMERVSAGDEQAFAQLYDATSRAVFGIVLRVLRDHAQAEEVTQEVYVEAWRSARRFDARLGSAKTWLNTIAHSRAVDRVRSSESSQQRERRNVGAMSATEPDDPSEAAVSVDEGRRVRAALQELPDAQRTALEMAYFDGHTQAEVAGLLQVPLGTVKTRMRDGMKRLRLRLGDGR